MLDPPLRDCRSSRQLAYAVARLDEWREIWSKVQMYYTVGVIEEVEKRANVSGASVRTWIDNLPYAEETLHYACMKLSGDAVDDRFPAAGYAQQLGLVMLSERLPYG